MTQAQICQSKAGMVTDLYEMSALMRMMHENAADRYPELNYIWRSFEMSLEQSASCLDELLAENERLKERLADCTEN